MASQDDLERYEATEAQELLRLFAAVRPPPVMQAPPHFRARVLDHIVQLPPRRSRLAWLRQGWAPAWAPALAFALLLSLGANVWLGYETLGQRKPIVSLPVDSAQVPRITMRGGGIPQGGQPGLAVEGSRERELAEALRQLAHTHYREGRYVPVIAVASATLLLLPNDASAYRDRGLAYEQIGQRAQAILDLQQAARLADSQAQAVLRTWGVTW